ncbi:MAG: hypothetical protein WC655_14865 [Candidatus Hydrogenedentales bacterium]|jgi:hypothetical protein
MSDEFWKRFPVIPGFDCVQMKNDIQAKIYDEIKGLSSEELVAYFNRAGRRFRERTEIPTVDSKLSMAHEEPASYDAKSSQED